MTYKPGNETSEYEMTDAQRVFIDRLQGFLTPLLMLLAGVGVFSESLGNTIGLIIVAGVMLAFQTHKLLMLNNYTNNRTAYKTELAVDGVSPVVAMLDASVVQDAAVDGVTA